MRHKRLKNTALGGLTTLSLMLLEAKYGFKKTLSSLFSQIKAQFMSEKWLFL